MATLRIDYDQQQQLVILSAGDDLTDIQWSAVRRLCEERCSDTTNIRPNALVLPWWRFISFRDGLRYVLQIQKVNHLEISPIAQALLKQSVEREQQYNNATTRIGGWTVEQVQDNLRKVAFSRQLMWYQSRNIVRLLSLPACATFSVPGSGKTTEALAIYFLTCQSEDRLFIVAPKNAFASWEDELVACVPTCPFEFVRLTGGYNNIHQLLKRNPKAVLVSYHQLALIKEIVVEYLAKYPSYVMVDESHRIKRGADGVHGSAVLSLSHLAKHKIVLSGTPMPNSRVDLVPQFNFLYPELRSNDNNIVSLISNIYVRTTKAELGLSEPIRIRHTVEMSPAQKRLYELLSSDAARHLAGLSASDRMRFRQFARCVQYMLQATSNPSLLTDTPIASHEAFVAVLAEGLAPKLKEVCRLVRGWVKDGQKVLVWSYFVKTVEHLAGLLADIGAEYIHGGVNVSDDEEIWDSREAKIKRFKDPNSSCKVLVANPAACAESISLHRICHRAIYIDRNYNAAQYLQSEDRIHRIGLDPNVKTYITILHCSDTIDDSVDRRLQAKVAAMRSVLNDPGLNITPIDLDDDSDGLDQSDLEDLKRLLLRQS